MRLQIELSATQLKELEALMEECDLSTKKALYDNALTLFAWAVKEVQHGNVIASINEEEHKYRELQMPALAAAASFKSRTPKKSRVPALETADN